MRIVFIATGRMHLGVTFTFDAVCRRRATAGSRVNKDVRCCEGSGAAATGAVWAKGCPGMLLLAAMLLKGGPGTGAGAIGVGAR